MNKPIAIISGILVLLIGAGIVYALNASDSQSSTQGQNPAVTTHQKTENQSSEPSQASTPGAYVNYQKDIIATTPGTKLLFFHAPWCPQCRTLESDIEQRGVPEGVTIIKVDYDSNQKLRQQYGVTLQTTVVKVDDEGNLVKKFVAYDDPSLVAVTEALL